MSNSELKRIANLKRLGDERVELYRKEIWERVTTVKQLEQAIILYRKELMESCYRKMVELGVGLEGLPKELPNINYVNVSHFTPIALSEHPVNRGLEIHCFPKAGSRNLFVLSSLYLTFQVNYEERGVGLLMNNLVHGFEEAGFLFRDVSMSKDQYVDSGAVVRTKTANLRTSFRLNLDKWTALRQAAQEALMMNTLETGRTSITSSQFNMILERHYPEEFTRQTPADVS